MNSTIERTESTTLHGLASPKNFKRRPLIKRVIAATDLTKRSAGAVSYALSIANESNAELVLMYLSDDEAIPGNLLVERRPTKNLPINLIARLEELREEIANESPETSVYVYSGDAQVKVATVARELNADLVVLSPRKRSWYSYMINGSDADEIVRSAPCPVLIVGGNNEEEVQS